MAWEIINNDEIATGEPVKGSTMAKVKNDLEDLNARVEELEVGAAEETQTMTLSLGGDYSSLLSEYLFNVVADYDISIVDVVLYCITAGSAGTTTISIDINNGAGWVALFDTNPSIVYTAGNYSNSTNGVVDEDNNTVNEGKFLRVKLEATQTAPSDLIIKIKYVKV